MIGAHFIQGLECIILPVFIIDINQLTIDLLHCNTFYARCCVLSSDFHFFYARTVTSKRTQIEFELPPIDLVEFNRSIHDISIAEIVSSLHTTINR